MNAKLSTGICAILAAAFFINTSWAETKPVAKHASKPVVDSVFPYPAATGVMPCDDSVKVTINKDAKRVDGFDVILGKTRYVTTRVPTESGAIRLENKTTGIVWLQMSNKSMLFNEKAGKRLANNCRNVTQESAETKLSESTAPTALDDPAIKKP